MLIDYPVLSYPYIRCSYTLTNWSIINILTCAVSWAYNVPGCNCTRDCIRSMGNKWLMTLRARVQSPEPACDTLNHEMNHGMNHETGQLTYFHKAHQTVLYKKKVHCILNDKRKAPFYQIHFSCRDNVWSDFWPCVEWQQSKGRDYHSWLGQQGWKQSHRGRQVSRRLGERLGRPVG